MIEYHRGLPVQRIMQDCSYERLPSLPRCFSVESLQQWTPAAGKFPDKEPEKTC